MIAIHVEFAGGGPIDGRRRDMPDPGPEVRVYTPRTGADPMVTYVQSEIATAVGVDTHIYRRAGRLTTNGYEIYVYAGKERRS